MSADVAPADLVVVGGGLLGAATADAAVALGATTVLVDRGDAGAATAAGAGILSPETWADPDDDWFAFAMAAAAHYRSLAPALAEAPGPDPGYGPCPLVSVAFAETEEPWFDELARLAGRRSGGLVGEVAPEEVRRRFPPLAPVRRALLNPAAARVDGGRMAAALLQRAAAGGLRRLQADVTGVSRRGDQVVALATSAGPLACGGVVVAGGAWSAELARALGVALPVTPTRGQIVHLELPGADSGDWPIVQPVANYYLVPWPGGRVACGGTLEPEAGFDARPTAGGVHQLLRECLRMAPGLRAATVRTVRVGLRPTSADGRPLLGAVPGWSNAHVATGHGTEGLLLGPYSGHLVAAAALGGPADAALSPFSPARFNPGGG